MGGILNSEVSSGVESEGRGSKSAGEASAHLLALGKLRGYVNPEIGGLGFLA